MRMRHIPDVVQKGEKNWDDCGSRAVVWRLMHERSFGRILRNLSIFHKLSIVSQAKQVLLCCLSYLYNACTKYISRCPGPASFFSHRKLLLTMRKHSAEKINFFTNIPLEEDNNHQGILDFEILTSPFF